MISSLFPADVVTAFSLLATEDHWLHPEEAECVRGASAERRREFALGRSLAHQVFERFGIGNAPLVSGFDRAPVWPNDLIGSISHCDGLCGVAVARRGRIINLGLDLEVAAPLPSEIVELVCTPTERFWAQRAPGPKAADWFTFIFSAKECTYKALYPITGKNLDFHDLEVSIRPADSAFVVRLTSDKFRDIAGSIGLRGRIASSSNHIATGLVALEETDSGELHVCKVR